MTTIWKFSKTLAELDDGITFNMPIGTKILSVGNQRESLCVWALVDEKLPLEKRLLYVIGTGHSAPRFSKQLPFLGTVQFAGGTLVFHIFESK